mmetsp:Transcript_69367/g.137128  ORF Transcript_69367/g.137128 Transcript_69367/m.137128 type:complete len:123 (+) Transcript_69367:181-549(+)
MSGNFVPWNANCVKSVFKKKKMHSVSLSNYNNLQMCLPACISHHVECDPANQQHGAQYRSCLIVCATGQRVQQEEDIQKPAVPGQKRLHEAWKPHPLCTVAFGDHQRRLILPLPPPPRPTIM